MIDPGFILMMYMRSKNLIKINDMELTLDELTHLIKLANKNANESCVVTNNFKLSRSVSKKSNERI